MFVQDEARPKEDGRLADSNLEEDSTVLVNREAEQQLDVVQVNSVRPEDAEGNGKGKNLERVYSVDLIPAVS